MSSELPISPTIGVIAMVPDRWDLQWQSRHHLMTRLSRYFYIVWLCPALEWRETLKNWSFLGSAPDTQRWPGLIVQKPEFWLPKLYRPGWLAKTLFQGRLRRARKSLLRRGCRKVVLYLWRPEFAAALGSFPFDLSCYHIADEYSFSDVEVPVSEIEKKVISEVDQVFILSPALLEKKGTANPHTAFVPNGVDYEAFSKPRPEPRDLQPIPHPRIGYCGWIKKMLDWPLLVHLTAQHPEWSFVFVGPQRQHSEMYGPIQEMSRRTNVHFLGAKPSDEVPAYLQHFEVCIMPYKLTDYTKYVYPLKLHEYLASGRPAVGSHARTLEGFTDVVYLARTVDEWSAAIKAALSGAANTQEARAGRQAVAQRHDWGLLVAQIAKVMANRLGEQFSEGGGAEEMRQTFIASPASRNS